MIAAPSKLFLQNVYRNTVDLLCWRALEALAIQFSGGRTSAFMLRRLLDIYSGSFPDTVQVLFQNTDHEMPETLDFIARCGAALTLKVDQTRYEALQVMEAIGVKNLQLDSGD